MLVNSNNNNFRNDKGDVLTIPYDTLEYIKKVFATDALLSDRKVKELSEPQQLGYLKGAAAVVRLLSVIHGGDD